MQQPFTHIADLAAKVELPADGTLSRTLYDDDNVKVVLFGFSEGQELSEHTAAKPAVLHFLSGKADVTLGTEPISASAGTWVHMQPHLPHSIRALEPTVMLLQLLK